MQNSFQCFTELTVLLNEKFKQGRTQRLKKGGGPGHRLVRRVARAARQILSRTYKGRSGGMLLYKFRRYESASEAVGDHHNHAKCLTITMPPPWIRPCLNLWSLVFTRYASKNKTLHETSLLKERCYCNESNYSNKIK